MPEEIKPKAAKVPRDKAFYFFTSIGNYTGKSASSLEEFRNVIREITAKSLEFHFYRGDFERWFMDVLEDQELVEELRKFYPLNLTGEVLREHLHRLVESRLRGS
ncbi:MAG: DUF5752 family protein [Candidatus Bathyarchaeota archaeon]|nr:DUF5752 family protein [Candidatus Bathyarchaeota archaeon]MCX8177125.1 DUF5752 family protein [Candidatus Bathyarchaeota archaeon]MDW8193705.1 DUF5752 family protein [Nitrososphaerota archaeon]